MLGDYLGGFLEYPDGAEAPIGQLVEWGPVTFEDGKLVTDPLPLLGWVGIRKD